MFSVIRSREKNGGIVRSADYRDIEFEMADCMTSAIVSVLIKKRRRKFRDGVDPQTRRDMPPELFGKWDPAMYQRAKQRSAD